MGLGGVGFPRNWAGLCGWSRAGVCGVRLCCPCAGRRRDRFQGGRCRGGLSSWERCGPAAAVNRWRAGAGRGHDRGVLPVTPYCPWCCRARTKVWRWGRSCGLGTVASSTPIRFGFPRAAPRAASSCKSWRESEAVMAAKSKDAGVAAEHGSDTEVPERGGDGAEVAEDRVQVVEYAAAVDVAKGSGMVCTRVPGSRPDRRRQKTWQVKATVKDVTALMDHLRSEGIQRLVLESTSDYWRIWYYLAEAAGLEVWLVNARDVKHLPGRGKSDKADCVWLCKLNERGMLRRSFVPPQAVRDLRMLTRTRSRLAQDQARHQARVEKILEDALLKISVVISDLFGASGRRFLDALVAGERSPRALAALGDPRLRATRQELAEALTGQFRDVHALEIRTHLAILDVINEQTGRLDEAIEAQLALVPRTAPACTSCGEIGGGHAPGCAGEGTPVPGLAERLDEITGIGERNAQVLIAE